MFRYLVLLSLFAVPAPAAAITADNAASHLGAWTRTCAQLSGLPADHAGNRVCATVTSYLLLAQQRPDTVKPWLGLAWVYADRETVAAFRPMEQQGLVFHCAGGQGVELCDRHFGRVAAEIIQGLMSRFKD